LTPYISRHRDISDQLTPFQAHSLKNERAGQVPYGWRLAADRKTLLENEEQQKTVSLIRDLRKKGCSLRSICQELETMGHKPVGNKWHPKTIASILGRVA